MHNRLQLSLIVDDDDVYNNLLLPAKSNRELHPLCIRLFNAYYYNEEVRNLVDGVSSDAEGYEETDNSIMDAIASLRNNLAVQTFLSSDLTQVLENGAEDIANLSTGDSVKMSGNDSDVSVEFIKNSAGNTNVRLLTHNQEVKQLDNSSKATTSRGQEPDALDLVKYLARMLNIDLSGAYNSYSHMDNSNTSQSVVSETAIQSETSNVVSTHEVSTEVSEPIVVNEPTTSASDDFFNEDYTEVEEVKEEVKEENTTPANVDATDSIRELLGSLVS